MKAVLDHIGIAVKDLEAALTFYRDALGLEVEQPEDVPSERVRAHFVPVGESNLELLEGMAPDSPIAAFVQKRGPGLHHITLRVGDIVAAIAQLKARGARLIALDGGSIFGSGPKPPWAPDAPPHDRNRITLAMQPLIVRRVRTMIIDA